MTVLAGIGFTAPWLLLGLIVLPILWLILRAVPPAPLRQRFPGVALLLGLTDDEQVSDKTPWWLLLLRCLAVGAIILGLAGPVLNPNRSGDGGSQPLLVVLDSSWAGVQNWARSTDAARAQLLQVEQRGRTAALLDLGDPQALVFQSPSAIAERLSASEPNAWQPNPETLSRTFEILAEAGDFDTLWMSDGLDYPGRDGVLDALEAKGAVRVIQGGLPAMALRPAEFADGAVKVTILRASGGLEQSVTLVADGLDPAGNPAVLARVETAFEPSELELTAELSLPAELRARVTGFSLETQRSAGATSLVDDNLKRREIALIATRDGNEGLQLLNPMHYLQQALDERADVLTGALEDVLPANPDVIVLADVAKLSTAETDALLEWAERGGLLLRFAGPRVAASDVSRTEEDPLMPVRLRSGGRSVGGAMSWGEPKALAPFAPSSPFFGLTPPEDVRISAQVMAQPDPNLSQRVIAELSDGTPLVTRKAIGDGAVVLFHVTANAEWANLPLSVLFVQMLDRLSVTATLPQDSATDLEGTTWTPQKMLTARGTLEDAGTLPGIEGPDLLSNPLGAGLPPGLYSFEDDVIARNVIGPQDVLTPAAWPARIPVTGLNVARELPLAGLLLGLAILALAVDVVASLALSGKLANRNTRATAGLLVAFLAAPQMSDAQSETDFALNATAELVLAYVITGDRQVDEIADAGLRGLSDTLFFRTSVEPANPVGVNLETDELSFFPILYWPITPNQPRPSAEAYIKLNAYLRSGGLILFDTRDADLAGFGSASPNGRKLQDLAAPLDIPALEPVPSDHVLTRTFYLLQDFPGRHLGRDVWVEAAPADAQAVDGMPFRNLNDGVTPVVIGGNDWASAWAVTDDGLPMLPIGRGFGSGERQRELAFRFGVNLIMHVLTGNYKSDQVHVPALLDRLSQ